MSRTRLTRRSHPAERRLGKGEEEETEKTERIKGRVRTKHSKNNINNTA